MVSLLPPIALRWCQGQKIGLSDVSLSAAGQEIAKEAEDTTSSAKSALRIYHENDTFLGVGRIVSSEGGMVLAPQVVLEDIRP
jgi:tRNA pseudouridine55 synthase